MLPVFREKTAVLVRIVMRLVVVSHIELMKGALPVVSHFISRPTGKELLKV